MALALTLGQAAHAFTSYGIDGVASSVGGAITQSGKTYDLYLPDNTGSTFGVRIYLTDGSEQVSIGNSPLTPSGGLITLSKPASSAGYTVDICDSSATFAFESGHCDNSWSLGVRSTATSDPYLASLDFAGFGNVLNSFGDTVAQPDLTVPGSTSSITVTPLVQDTNGETVTVNGASAPATVALNPAGQTTVITTHTTSASGSLHQDYVVTVHRGLTDADLSALSIAPGSISFDAATTSYAASVPSGTTTVDVEATTHDANATYQVEIGGNPVADQTQVPLSDTDPTQIDVVVTADDTTTQKTYSIDVSHLASETLTVGFAGDGSGTVTSNPPGTVNCSTQCTAQYDATSAVKLDEAPAAGSYFDGWSGDCPNTGSETSFTMPAAAATCTATFKTLGAKQAGTLHVNDTGDDAGASDLSCYANKCTLRDALASVANGGKIVFDDANPTIALTDNIAFDGSKAEIDGPATIDGTGSSNELLEIAGGTLTLTDLTFSNGDSFPAVVVESSATGNLDNVDVSGFTNTYHGAVYVRGTLNWAGGSADSNSAFSCGALFVTEGGTATLTNVSLTNNSAVADGGAMCVDSGSSATLIASQLTSNQAGEGGGGIVNSGTMTISRTAIDGNQSPFGAGMWQANNGSTPTATLTNVTFYNNQGDWALTSDGDNQDDGPTVAKLANVTFFSNQGGIRGTGVSLLNTLFSHNNGLSCDGPNEPTSLGHNLSEDSSCTGVSTILDARLQGNANGHFHLFSGSPALDAGTATAAGGVTVPTIDALGTARPQGGGVDVGAVEEREHKLVVKTAGPGTGTVDESIPPATGGWYIADSVVTLTPTPADGSAFAGWSGGGGCTGSDDPLHLIISADLTCTALFTATPTVKSFAPSSGDPLTAVTITGTHFTGATDVKFDGHSSPGFKIVSDAKITATVPSDATTGTIEVDNPANNATSTGTFTVKHPVPKVSSFAPAKAGVGLTITLTGSGFGTASAVSFNGTAATDFTATSDQKITVTVPDGATTGTISVTSTPGGTGTSKTSFTVLPAPTLTTFLPATGPVGTRITITGTNFTGAKHVTLGGIQLAFKVVNATTITATVPFNGGTGLISVETPGGTVASSSPFAMTYPQPTIKSFAPGKALPRAKVTITGTHFGGASEVTVAGEDADYTVVSDTKITLVVPDDAQTGKIAVTTPGGTVLTTASFTAQYAKPTVASFTPASGIPGGTVTIAGSGFLGATEVDFNGHPAASFTVVNATKITVTIPDAATSGKITVTTPAGSGTSAKSFTITI